MISSCFLLIKETDLRNVDLILLSLTLLSVILLVRNEEKDTTKYYYYFLGALACVLAMVTSNMALKWVNYPTQVLAKAGKAIPVLIMGVLFAKKSYRFQKYIFVLIMVIGVAMFMFKEDKAVVSGNEKFGLGEGLLLISLIMDGFLGVVQDRMRDTSKPSAMSFMFSMNLWGSGILFVLLIATWEGPKFYKFVCEHPEVLLDLGSLAIAGCFGQLFICMMIQQFGSLPTAITTTIRKFFSILCSVLIYGPPLTILKWFAMFLVFFGLFADIFFGKKVFCVRNSNDVNPQVGEENELKVGHDIPQLIIGDNFVEKPKQKV